MKIKFMALLLAAVVSCQTKSAAPNTALDQLENDLRTGTAWADGQMLRADSYERVGDALILKGVHMVSPDGTEVSAIDCTVAADGDGWRLTLVDIDILSANGDTTHAAEMHLSLMGTNE